MKTLIRFSTVKIRFLFHPFISRKSLYVWHKNVYYTECTVFILKLKIYVFRQKLWKKSVFLTETTSIHSMSGAIHHGRRLKIWRISGSNFIWVLYYDALCSLNTYQCGNPLFKSKQSSIELHSRLKALSHHAIFLETCNAILLMGDVKLANICNKFFHWLKTKFPDFPSVWRRPRFRSMS